jgi:uncharacterized membrane protein (DUF106 family)
MLALMLKVLKRALLIVGGLGIVAAVFYHFFVVWQDVRNLYSVAVSNQSTPSVQNPNVKIIIVMLTVLVAGVILGIGIAFPGKKHLTPDDVEKQVRQKLEDAQIAQKAAAKAAGQAADRAEDAAAKAEAAVAQVPPPSGLVPPAAAE